MFSESLLPVLRCPSCLAGGQGRAAHSSLILTAPDAGSAPLSTALRCQGCDTRYPVRDGYVDLRPRDEPGGSGSLYDGEEFGEALQYQQVYPPVLAAGVRQRILQQVLATLNPASVLDLGCGNGKFSLWNLAPGRTLLALDGSPWFADDARLRLPLARADLRRLPLAAESVDAAFSIDVLEHLSLEDAGQALREARRVLKPGGHLLLYSNTREPSRLEALVELERRAASWLVQRGLADDTLDRLRKADHLKGIETHAQLDALLAAIGFQLVWRRYWNGVLQTFIESLVVRPLEQVLARRRRSSAPPATRDTERAELRHRIATRAGWRLRALHLLTRAMALDLRLFGNLPAGPYFALLRRAELPSGPDPEAASGQPSPATVVP